MLNALPKFCSVRRLRPGSSRAARWFADFDAEVMPGVGHYPMLEQPAKFTEALRRAI